LIFVASIVALWLLALQPITLLWSYLRLSFLQASAFAQAMSLPGDPRDWSLCGYLLVAALMCAAPWLARRPADRRGRAAMSIGTMFVLFIVMKSG
jgi:hypothetical protein